MSDIPEDPFPALGAARTQVHELFESLMSSGFSEKQALTLLAIMMAQGDQNPG
jgi:hypothetical protein